MKPTWKIADFFRNSSTDRVCQAIYPYIHNAGQEGKEMLPARETALELIRLKYGHQFLTSFAAARDPKKPGGAYEVLTWLDKLHVPLDELDAVAQTPLFYAAREANYEAIVFLLQRGANAERLDHNKQTALFYAAKSDPKQGGTRLDCEKRRGGRGSALVDSRKNIRTDLDANGRPHKENRLAVVEILVEYGADPTHQDELRRSAVDYARDKDMIKKLEALCQQCKQRKTPRPPPPVRMLPPVEPPCMYFSKLDAAYDGQYMVAYSDPQDVSSLVQLESEFIQDHARITQGIHGQPAPAGTICKSVGVCLKESDRRKIIKSITGQRDRLVCTMKIMHVDAYSQKEKHAACAQLMTPPKVVGYMYQKVDFSQPDRTNGAVEVSHLKIANSHVRRGLATMLFCGLVQHRGSHEGNELRSLQLSVFDGNDAACRLYEKLGFVSDGEPWDSELEGWGGAQEPARSIRWRRYRRSIPGETPNKALATFEAHLPYTRKLRVPPPSSNDPPAKRSRPTPPSWL